MIGGWGAIWQILSTNIHLSAAVWADHGMNINLSFMSNRSTSGNGRNYQRKAFHFPILVRQNWSLRSMVKSTQIPEGKFLLIPQKVRLHEDLFFSLLLIKNKGHKEFNLGQNTPWRPQSGRYWYSQFRILLTVITTCLLRNFAARLC